MYLGHNPSTRLMPLGHKVRIYGIYISINHKFCDTKSINLFNVNELDKYSNLPCVEYDPECFFYNQLVKKLPKNFEFTLISRRDHSLIMTLHIQSLLSIFSYNGLRPSLDPYDYDI
jgi:hypothetical protein